MFLRRVLPISVLVLAASTSVSRADSVVLPFTYKVLSPNEKYVFVMRSPLSFQPLYCRVTRAEAEEILATYPSSGLYRNDGSRKPLWTVDRYMYYVSPASDGIHLVVQGGQAPRAISFSEAMAVQFYAEGRLLRSYTVAALVDAPQWSFSHSMNWVSWYEEDNFDDDNLQYSIRTWDGNHFVFDVRTGEILSSSRPLRWVMACLYLLIAAPAVYFLGRLYRQARRRRTAPAV
jgi:hypothetical protein